ncbi:MAG: hypothetical protein K0Q79_3203 [Flavipsychrobacter sp.]|nr:hypothetical protein [Flavipsychrobacter sp.]
MVSVENFTQATCEKLLAQGYSYFVIKHRLDKDEVHGHCNVVTFQAVRENVEKAIPITQVMDLPAGTMTKYYVMVADEQ